MNDRQVFLRPFQEKDLAELVRIEKLSFAVNPRSGAWFKRQWTLWSENFWVAEIEGKVAGYALAKINKEKAKISRMAVHSQYRREGVGQQLMSFLLNDFRQKGIKKVQAEVRINNQGSIKFFKSFHFKIKERLVKYYRNGTDAYLMTVSL